MSGDAAPRVPEDRLLQKGRAVTDDGRVCVVEDKPNQHAGIGDPERLWAVRHNTEDHIIGTTQPFRETDNQKVRLLCLKVALARIDQYAAR